jgi:hypothetical protein
MPRDPGETFRAGDRVVWVWGETRRSGVVVTAAAPGCYWVRLNRFPAGLMRSSQAPHQDCVLGFSADLIRDRA